MAPPSLISHLMRIFSSSDLQIATEGAFLSTDEEIHAWRKSTMSELKTLGINGALIAAVVSAAFSWPSIDTAPWPSQAFFYCSLMFSVMVVGVSVQQITILNAVGSQSLQKLGHFVRKEGGKWATRTAMNAPIRFLDLSILTFFAGLLVLVFDRAATEERWGKDGKIAVVVGLALAFLVGMHVLDLMFIAKLSRATVDDGKGTGREERVN
ncbi:hypothetical protein CC80DRAFT_590348 [Byssothecium circinans]|uniref:Uncharacterized protein n=1 Tax=Byssothecium circinans TaxID=147558 RepID=A0A6A5U841_9PLEO|nr:hypothetical protein CC80DRAFT_590348 [Byssothecium circinans]